MKLEAALTMKKSEWKRRIKDKVRNKIQKNVEKEIESKTKPRTVRKNNQERKKQIVTCNSDLKKDYKNQATYVRTEKKEDMKCLICNGKEDTTKRVLECQQQEQYITCSKGLQTK